ncbi:hypothetical protein AUP68_07648 [Ilyonectria robusta]
MAEILRTRYKVAIQAIQLLLVLTVLVISVVRMLDRPAGAPRSRGGTMSLGMSAKSLVILLYEILTEHVRSLKRFQSLKAYTILNALEIVFWGSVVYLTIQSNTKYCVGTRCVLGWVIVGLAITLSILAFCMALVCFGNFRNLREQQEQEEYQAAMKAKAKEAALGPSQGTEQLFERDGTHGSHGRHGRERVEPVAPRRSSRGYHSFQGHQTPSGNAHHYGKMHPTRGRLSTYEMYSSHGNNSANILPSTNSRHSFPSQQSTYRMDPSQGMQNFYAQPGQWETHSHHRLSTQGGYPVTGGSPTYVTYPYQFVQYGAGQQVAGYAGQQGVVYAGQQGAGYADYNVVSQPNVRRSSYPILR